MNNMKEARRNNAKIYPLYKMCAWDLLSFYSIEYLFYTITKSITTSQVLIINGLSLLFSIIMQVPAVALTDYLGKRKSIILGNLLWIIYLVILICFSGVVSIILANLIFYLGYDIKTIAETNLLYDSVSTKGGEGLYSKIDAKGGCLYYILDSIASLLAGYFFVINNYLPMFICLGFVIISTLISFKFKDVYKQNKSCKVNLNEYKEDLKSSFTFILKSNRMKSFILFQMVFYAVIEIIDIYRGELLINVGIPEEQYSIIFALLTFIGGISIALKRPIEKKFKNRTLTFISIMYINACIIIGIVSSIWNTSGIIPIILVMYTLQKINTSIWYILESKYLKNFTKENTRNKITFTYEFIGGISASIFSILGGLLLEIINVENAFLIVGLIALVIMTLVLDYMKKRFGLKPEQYTINDIHFN